jgi:hypothetical protein
VRDGPTVLVASDLKGRTVYPVAYFYLGEHQPDRNVHPIIGFSSVRAQGPAGVASVATEAPLTFTFPAPPGGCWRLRMCAAVCLVDKALTAECMYLA